MINIEITEKDCNGEDVYLEIVESEHTENFLNCYAYRKVQKRFLFWKIIEKKYIHNDSTSFDSSLFDSRCNSYMLLSEIDSENIDRMVQKLTNKVLAQVNKSIKQKEKIENSKKLIKQFKKK
jgi:uncharacterized protein YaaR (DUF327 family)